MVNLKLVTNERLHYFQLLKLELIFKWTVSKRFYPILTSVSDASSRSLFVLALTIG
jgi:hypothetical protein